MNGLARRIVGIDEVGRGALAGPVVVAAAFMQKGLRFKDLKDSKQLSPRQREKWFARFQSDPRIHFASARVYQRGIEKMNISKAANLAAERAYKKLTKSMGSGFRRNDKKINVFLDGGLFLGNKNRLKSAKTIVKGDEKIAAIAVASIVAKISRDRFMARLAKKYPQYGFEIHKGYGTKAHFKAIRRNGPCEAHRLTFLNGKYRMN